MISNIFYRNIHSFAIILIYKTLFIGQRKAVQIFTQSDARNFFFSSEIDHRAIRKSLRGKFRKNQNIDVESSSLFQCKDKIMYMCQVGFSLEMIF